MLHMEQGYKTKGASNVVHSPQDAMYFGYNAAFTGGQEHFRELLPSSVLPPKGKCAF